MSAWLLIAFALGLVAGAACTAWLLLLVALAQRPSQRPPAPAGQEGRQL